MAKESLLDKALNIKVQRATKRVSDEEVELALAWMMDEVSLNQVRLALGNKETSQPYALLANAIKTAFSNGLITVRPKK